VLRTSTSFGTERAARRRALLGVCLAALAVQALSGAATAAARPVFAMEALRTGERASYFVLDARPGATLKRAVRVVNTGDTAGTVRLYAVDATTGQTTGAVYRGPRDPRRTVGAWTALGAKELRLKPKQSKTVPVVVRVPRGARPGQHLGGVVAETAELNRGRTRERSRGKFRVDVRSLTIAAVQVDVPGPRRQRMAITGVRAGGDTGVQRLLVGLRNDGNQLVKGRGEVVVRDGQGRAVKRVPFAMDTFVPQTAVANPLPVPGRGLPAGTYRASVTLRYGDGKVARRTTALTISDEQVEQVFGSPAQQAPPGARQASDGVPVVWLVACGIALLACGFGASALLFRRQRKR
jgi:hypothetical protein